MNNIKNQNKYLINNKMIHSSLLTKYSGFKG